MQIKYDNQDKEWADCLSDKGKNIHAKAQKNYIFHSFMFQLKISVM